MKVWKLNDIVGYAFELKDKENVNSEEWKKNSRSMLLAKISS